MRKGNDCADEDFSEKEEDCIDNPIWCDICGVNITDNCDYYYVIPELCEPKGMKPHYYTKHICVDCWSDYITQNLERSNF